MIREMFMSSTVATLAIPDLLECPEPLARTFKEVEKLAIDGFSMMEGNISKVSQPSAISRPVLTRFYMQDVEESEGLRR